MGIITIIINVLTSIPKLFTIVERVRDWLKEQKAKTRKNEKDEAVRKALEEYKK